MPAPLELADILRRHGSPYRQLHADSLNREAQRVMRAIEQCRTAALGGHVEQCDTCGHQRIAYNSCLMVSTPLRGAGMCLRRQSRDPP